ncbi:MAG: 3-oxoacyl-ACP synthase [Flavobacteriaceae bacterium]|nr:3-oxoacyl-ACP synthase [Flavobacteriaceae bacterium]
MSLKEQLFLACRDFISKKRLVIENVISEIETSLQSETKSSAGDKHETGRAMLQLEREKAGNQLAEIDKQEELLSKIDISKANTTVSLGSVVFTTEASYFLAIGVGEIIVDNRKFYAVSTKAPISQALLGKRVDDNIVFRNRKFKIIHLI